MTKTKASIRKTGAETKNLVLTRKMPLKAVKQAINLPQRMEIDK